MGKLARVDGNGANILGNNALENEKRQMLEAREFISKSIQFGCKQRKVYCNMLDNMKAIGKYPSLHDTLL